MSNSTISTLTLHKDSRALFKIKPKIRIVHIFEPEIIKADVHNFRDLVQSLTGKPKPKPKPEVCKAETLVLDKSPAVIMKEEQGMWSADQFFGDASGGFLKDFAYLDGFDLQDLQHHFPDLLYHNMDDHQASSSSPYNSSSAINSSSQNEYSS